MKIKQALFNTGLMLIIFSTKAVSLISDVINSRSVGISIVSKNSLSLAEGCVSVIHGQKKVISSKASAH